MISKPNLILSCCGQSFMIRLQGSLKRTKDYIERRVKLLFMASKYSGSVRVKECSICHTIGWMSFHKLDTRA